MRHIYLLMREKSLFGKPASTQCTVQGVISYCLYVLLLLCPAGRSVHSSVATLKARCIRDVIKMRWNDFATRRSWGQRGRWRSHMWDWRPGWWCVAQNESNPHLVHQQRHHRASPSSSATAEQSPLTKAGLWGSAACHHHPVTTTSFCKIFNKRGQKSTQIRSLVYGNNFAHFSANPFAGTTTASLPDIPFFWLRVTWTRLKNWLRNSDPTTFLLLLTLRVVDQLMHQPATQNATQQVNILDR